MMFQYHLVLLNRNFTETYLQKSFVEKLILGYIPTTSQFSVRVEINCNYVPVGILLKIHLVYPLKQRKEQSKLILCSFHSNFGLLFILGFILVPVLSLLLLKSLWQNNIWSVLLTQLFSLPLFLLLCICVSSSNWAWFCGLHKDLL